MNEITFPTLTLDKLAIRAANDASHFEAGSVLSLEGQRIYSDGLRDLKPRSSWNQEQTEYAARRAVEWCALVTEAYNDIIRRRASWMPWTVSGPANYDSRRNNIRADRALKASAEWSEKFSRFHENTARQLYELQSDAAKINAYRTGKDDSPISADDPLAVEKLTARLEYLKEQHERNLLLNKHYRKHGTMRGAPGLDDQKAAELDAHLADLPECMRSIGFTANETANIRRLEARLDQLTKARAAASSTPSATEYNGIRMEQDTAANRLRLYFDEKPDEQTRDLLKRSGFRWAPSVGAWQRQLTANAIRAAERIMEDFNAPETLTLDEFARRFCK